MHRKTDLAVKNYENLISRVIYHLHGPIIANFRDFFGLFLGRPKVTILPSGYMLQKIWGAFVTSFNADQWELRIKSRDRPPLVVASY